MHTLAFTICRTIYILRRNIEIQHLPPKLPILANQHPIEQNNSRNGFYALFNLY